tara:strand:- start:1553 stop:2170 length:618 start_codon:yes stop_codon:yes gene_type:complete
MNENNILATILAGGKSSRFGADKSFVKLGGRSLLDHTIQKIKRVFNEILIVSNGKAFRKKDQNIKIIQDCIPGQLGPLVGVLTAMKWVKKNKKKYKWIATFPCDTPFFDIKIFYHLIKKSRNRAKKLYFFKSGNIRHNIFGLWSLELEKILEKDIKNNHRKVESWANKVGLELIEIDKKKRDTFLNINTKKELKIAKTIIKNDYI